ncbi:hypothetical protein R1sor_023098 [Riccia sorocarpa]|uniref:Hexosyltransferase n=1 Tax=Riccia sorocarpa TaxID=122646 RepID=A0ABD3GNT3_9MARC
MPSSSPFFGRKLPFARATLWNYRVSSRQAACSPRILPRVLWGCILILLIAVALLLHRQLTCGTKVVVGCGAAEDTLRSLITLPAPQKKVVQQLIGDEGKLKRKVITGIINEEADGLQLEDNSRPKVLGFVGIQTGFGSAERRRALRQTWMPSTRDGLARLQEQTGLAFRFIIGYTDDQKQMAELEKEIEVYNDFVRIDNREEYKRLTYKTLTFFKAAYLLFDADFYVKADDDIYLRPDRLSMLLAKERTTPRTYLGCMKKGSVITSPAYKWYEPLAFMLGNEYFLHAYGPIYALSRGVVADLVTFKDDSLRMFSNEDVTIGSWMLAFNVQYEDDRTLCDPECHPNSVAVWDIPTCSGLCHSEQRLLQLHKEDMCSKSPTVVYQ